MPENQTLGKCFFQGLINGMTVVENLELVDHAAADRIGIVVLCETPIDIEHQRKLVIEHAGQSRSRFKHIFLRGGQYNFRMPATESGGSVPA